MDIEIRKLAPELVKDYIHFFDVTPHDDGIDEHKCYCVGWSNAADEGYDFSTAQNRRQAALQLIQNDYIQGYLAYAGDEVVGWCNANTKHDCIKCGGWQMCLDYVPVSDEETERKTKSIFCFVIAPKVQRKGIATKLVKRVCEDAATEGFRFVEVYPYKEDSYQTSDFGGYEAMYTKLGFSVTEDTQKGLVMRKEL